MPKSTQQFIHVALATTVCGYGLTECAAALTVQEPVAGTKLGTVGVPLISSEYKLVDVENSLYKTSNKPKPQGEIWMRGPSLMKGYYKQEQLTRDNITDDGWLMTGDIGEINEDGSLTIIDRKKNLIKLSNGEYIALEKLEANYKVSKYVQNMMVFADPEKSYAVAIIQPVESALRVLAKEVGIAEIAEIEYEEICKSPEVRAAVERNLKEIAKSLNFSSAEILGRVALVQDEWTPQNGLVTAAMKLQRRSIAEKYKSEIERMY